MATPSELQGQIEKLQGQLKELSGRKMVYSKDRKFAKLTREVDVSEWLQDIGEFVKTRFGCERERVMFLRNHPQRR